MDEFLWASLKIRLADALAKITHGEQGENLEEAIVHYHQALEVITQEIMPLEWATATMNLATTYSKRIRGDKAKNLEEAITHFHRVLEVITREAMPLGWAQASMNLALAYDLRIHGERAENLERTVAYYRQALEVITRETMPLEWAITVSYLARAYYARIRGEQADNLERAISYYQQVLEVIPREAMPLGWAEITIDLALAYRSRIRGERADNVEQAIFYQQQALEVMIHEAEPLKWVETMSELAVTYCSRIRGDRAGNLERAISYYHQVLNIWTYDTMPFEWAGTMSNLGVAYYSRIRGERAENLEQAIRHFHHALEVRTRAAMPLEWAEITSNLALAYSARMRGERGENLEQAIAYYEQVLEVITREALPVKWATVTMNLAIAYSFRIRGQRAENLELAIHYYQQALKVRTRDTMPLEWAEIMSNLAIVYSTRIRGKQAENWEIAISYCQQALEVRTREALPLEWADSVSTLAIAYSSRIQGKRGENVEKAIELYWQALEVYQPETLPNLCRGTARNLGILLLEEAQWDAACAAFSVAFSALDVGYRASLSRFGKEAELYKMRGMSARAAFALAKLGRLDEALATLEQGRARLLGEALARDRADLTALEVEHADLVRRYREAADVLRLAQGQEQVALPAGELTSPADPRALIRAANDELAAVINEIRALPSYERFLELPHADEVRRAVLPGVPLAYLATTPQGTLLLVAHRAAADAEVYLEALWSDLTEETLQTWLVGPADASALGGWLGAYQRMIGAHSIHASAMWWKEIERVMGLLWDSLMSPLVTRLRELNVEQAVLVPGGLLALLPLHAAWTADPGGHSYALDQIAFSYAPSAAALVAARRLAARADAAHLVTVDEPKPVSANDLPNSAAEVSAIADLFPAAATLRHMQATRAAVLAALPGADVLHASCHGGTNWGDTLRSGLLMANDEVLTVQDLFDQHLPGARLAALSACETGIVGTRLPDEVVALPSAFLQAGFAGVVASLWAVYDISTAMLMERFYRLWRAEGMEPVFALRKAQRWVRDTTNAEKAAYFERELPHESSLRMPGHVAADFFARLSLSQQEERSFEHPVWWAAFTLTGV